MSIAAPQYDKFKTQVIEDGKVFTFSEGGEYLVYLIHEHEVIPFWSSRTRMESIQKSFSKYRRLDVTELTLADFRRWLPKLGKQGIRIGANWSGKRLVGYDVEAKDLLAALKYLMKLKDKQ